MPPANTNVPTLDMTTADMSTNNLLAPPTPHMNSGRRLSKSVMQVDTVDLEGAKSWGMVSVRDGSGTARAVRVVQKAKAEDMNMVCVTWNLDLDDETGQMKTYTVELRHGRRSGIRKIYVNKDLVDRSKDLMKIFSDSGGSYPFKLGMKSAEIEIVAKGMGQGYNYKLSIDGNPIEQQTAAPGESQVNRGLDIGVRAVQLIKSANGLGMTLRNNPLGPNGVVVWTVEPGKAADNNKVKVGDVVLSVEEHIVNSIENLIEYVAASVGVVNMELAGTGPSKEIWMSKKLPNLAPDVKVPIGLGLQTTSCGVGVLITEIDPNTCAARSDLCVGDCILSIEDVVPKSPKHAVELILSTQEAIKFIIVDSSAETAPR